MLFGESPQSTHVMVWKKTNALQLTVILWETAWSFQVIPTLLP